MLFAHFPSSAMVPDKAVFTLHVALLRTKPVGICARGPAKSFCKLNTPPCGKKRNTKTVPFLLGSLGFLVLGVSRGLTHGEVDDKYKCTTLDTAWAEAACLQRMMGGSRLALQLSLFRRSRVRFPPRSEIFLSPWLLHKEVPDAVDQQRFFIHLMHIVALASGTTYATTEKLSS